MKPFKTHNTLGKPLCPCCGANPRKPGRVKCGRCERENRPVQWGRLSEQVKAELQPRSPGAGEAHEVRP